MTVMVKVLKISLTANVKTIKVLLKERMRAMKMSTTLLTKATVTTTVYGLAKFVINSLIPIETQLTD